MKLDALICFRLRAVMKRIDRTLSALLEEYNITLPQSFVLLCLNEEDGLTLKEIGSRTIIDSSSMTVLIDKLENEKLVQRQLDLQDRRAIRVFLTEEGRELAGKISLLGDSFNEKLKSLLSPENAGAFVDGLDDIYQGVDEL